MSRLPILLFAIFLSATLASSSFAQVIFQSNAVADTFVGTNGPGYASPPNPDAANSNYGGAGALQISPAGADRGERQSVIRFDLAGAVSSFNATFGVGGWSLSNVTLRLGSNFSIQGQQPNNAIFNPINAGLFDVRWMTDDSWVEGTGSPMAPGATGLTYNTLPSFLAAGDISLGIFSFVPAMSNPSQASYNLSLNAGFVSDISGGNLVSLHLLAADSNVSYLFNTRTFADPNNPALILTAVAIPEPGSLLLVGVASSALCAWKQWRRFRK